jgi:hypothetical protein
MNHDEGEGGNTLSPNSASKTKRIRRRKPGNLGQLVTILWGVLSDTEEIFQTQKNPEIKLRAAHALTSLSGVYVKALETYSLANELQLIREELRELKNGNRIAASTSQKPNGKPLN